MARASEPSLAAAQLSVTRAACPTALRKAVLLLAEINYLRYFSSFLMVGLILSTLSLDRSSYYVYLHFSMI
jgi:hypothetical protein